MCADIRKCFVFPCDPPAVTYPHHRGLQIPEAPKICTAPLSFSKSLHCLFTLDELTPFPVWFNRHFLIGQQIITPITFQVSWWLISHSQTFSEETSWKCSFSTKLFDSVSICRANSHAVFNFLLKWIKKHIVITVTRECAVLCVYLIISLLCIPDAGVLC